MSKVSSPVPVQVGGSLTYTLTVTNIGQLEAMGVTLTDTLPAGITFKSATSSQGAGCTQVGRTVTCALGSLAQGARATVSVVATVDPTTKGEITNTVSVRGNETDGRLGEDIGRRAEILGFECHD